MERFIKEYANHKKNDCNHNELMTKECKDKTINTIDKALKLRDKELITISETIKIILEA
jgi:hypothetical protein